MANQGPILSLPRKLCNLPVTNVPSHCCLKQILPGASWALLICLCKQFPKPSLTSSLMSEASFQTCAPAACASPRNPCASTAGLSPSLPAPCGVILQGASWRLCVYTLLLILLLLVFRFERLKQADAGLHGLQAFTALTAAFTPFTLANFTQSIMVNLTNVNSTNQQPQGGQLASACACNSVCAHLSHAVIHTTF